jgi:ParB family chromosome partitioning protein
MSERTRPQTVPIDTIDVGSRHRKDDGDLGDLVASLDALGMLQPVGLTAAGALVFGGRRIAAAKRLGWSEVPFVVVDTVAGAASALRAERDENVCRKEMTPSELVSLGRAIEEIERPRAAERRKSGAKAEPSGTGSGRSAGETRDKVGEALGVSGRTYEQAKKVVEQGTEELIEAMDAGELSVKDAAKVADLTLAKQRKVAGAKNPKRAAKEATAPKAEAVAAEPEEPTPVDEGAEFVRAVEALCRDIDQIAARTKQLKKSRFGYSIHVDSAASQIEAARKTLWQGRPAHPCPYCVASNSDGCKACNGTTRVKQSTMKIGQEAVGGVR